MSAVYGAVTRKGFPVAIWSDRYGLFQRVVLALVQAASGFCPGEPQVEGLPFGRPSLHERSYDRAVGNARRLLQRQWGSLVLLSPRRGAM